MDMCIAKHFTVQNIPHRLLGKPLKGSLALTCFTPPLDSGRDEEIQQPVRQAVGACPRDPGCLTCPPRRARVSTETIVGAMSQDPAGLPHLASRGAHGGRRNGRPSREWTGETARVTVGSCILSHWRCLKPQEPVLGSLGHCWVEVCLASAGAATLYPKLAKLSV